MKIFGPPKALVATVRATGQAWTKDTATYALGALTAGQRVYFAADWDNGTYAYDTMEVIWTVGRR